MKDFSALIEGRVTVERILNELKDIRIDETEHVLRGPEALHIEFNGTS